MANEISISAQLTLNKSGITLIGQVGSLSITQAGAQNISNTQAIGTTTEQLSLVDVATPGYLFVKNLDATNFVLVSLVTPAVSGTSFSKLLPGEAFLLPTRQTVIYAIADTASCNLQVMALDL